MQTHLPMIHDQAKKVEYFSWQEWKWQTYKNAKTMLATMVKSHCTNTLGWENTDDAIKFIQEINIKAGLASED